MGRKDFHDDAFDEGTITKLEIFQRYAREWFPVFLTTPKQVWSELHVYDFFSGPGKDINGIEGTPLRLIQEARQCRSSLLGDGTRSLHFHFSDLDEDKIATLKGHIAPLEKSLPNTSFQIGAMDFKEAFARALPIFRKPETANLVLLDPCAVNLVLETEVKELVRAPTTDFLLFVASSYLNRFRNVPAIQLKIKRPDDFYHVHTLVLERYRELIPAGKEYYLAPFSLKKRPNIYGLIFGSSHPLGIDKFLSVAWEKNPFNGEADFDIDREDFRESAPFLGLDMFAKPTKLQAFEAALRRDVLAGKCRNERDVVAVCFEHGVRRQHASPVLKKFKDEGTISYEFITPNFKKPYRPIRLL